jgi:hypothetical protein
MTIVIPLTKGKVAIVDDCDAELACFKWNNQGRYALRNIKVDGKFVTVLMHRFILSRILGQDLTRNEWVDHANNDGLDNRRSNLRLCTPQNNLRNKPVSQDNRSGYKGVSYRADMNKYVATIGLSYKQVYLGSYKTAIEAALAYDQAAREHFGDFAWLNMRNVSEYRIAKITRSAIEKRIADSGREVEAVLHDIASGKVDIGKFAKEINADRASVRGLLRTHGYIHVGPARGGYWTRATETEATE